MVAPKLDISDARDRLASLVDDLRRAPVIQVTDGDKAAFLAVDPAYFEAVMDTLEVLGDADTMRMLRESLADVQAGRVHDHESVKRELA